MSLGRTVGVLVLAVGVGIMVGAFLHSRSDKEGSWSTPLSELGRSGLGLETITDLAEANLLAGSELPGGESRDIWSSLSRLAEWTARIRCETDRHLRKFRRDPEAYNNSEAYFRVLMMVTVLQQDLGVRYNPERASNPDCRDSRDLFLPGLLADDSAGGTCASMPVLYVAVGRRLGYR